MNDEPESAAILQLLRASYGTRMSTATALEVYLVQRPSRARDVEEFLREAMIELVPFDAAQLDAAREAAAIYGKGTQHPAQLNYGDCMAYALATVTGEPLLFKGDDFTHTDVEPAYTP
ncbi:MAG: type II toxin-antitoxin system VapC family toxin [Nocardioides sp.]